MFAPLMLAAAFFVSSAKPTAVRTLTTQNYTITITEYCPMTFDCHHVTYKGVSKSGKTIVLQGSHIWHECPGTHNPCHPIGYQFKRPGIEYLVTEDGSLVVTQGTKTLVDEQGKWVDE
jgi:hypothetical protein